MQAGTISIRVLFPRTNKGVRFSEADKEVVTKIFNKKFTE